MDDQRPAVEVFDDIYAAPESPTERAVWAEAYGDEHLAEIHQFSFIARSELRRIAAELRVLSSSSFADLGCGRGGPGLWVARETGASLVGIDFSPVAVAKAEARAASFGVEGRARFAVASVQSTGLPTGSLDAAMSVDVVQIVPGRLATFTEAARILRPGARLCFTTWDFRPEAPDRPQRERIEDNRPLLEDAGFRVLAYDEPPGWLDRMLVFYDGVLARAAELRAELGETAATDLIAEAENAPPVMRGMRRVLAVAERRAE